MREKLQSKLDEVIEYILSKDAKDITFNEYRILDNKLSSIKYEEEQKEKNKELFDAMLKNIGTGFCSAPGKLSD